MTCTAAPPPPALCALHQHPRYGAAMQAIGADVTWSVLREGSDVAGTAQLLRRRFGPVRLSWMPRGPVLEPHRDARESLANFPVTGPTLVLPDTPRTAHMLRGLGHRAILTPQHVAEIDLTRPLEARFASLHGKWRNRLRAAQAAPLRTQNRPFDPERDTDLLRLDLAQQKLSGYSALPPAFTLAFSGLHRDATRLFIAQDRAGLQAFMLFLLHAPVATYHIGWAAPGARKTHAHTLLMWQAMTHLAERGFARLDLGQIDTEAAPGLARFKLGTGARARALGPTLLRLLPRRSGRLAA